MHGCLESLGMDRLEKQISQKNPEKSRKNEFLCKQVLICEAGFMPKIPPPMGYPGDQCLPRGHFFSHRVFAAHQAPVYCQLDTAQRQEMNGYCAHSIP